VDKTSILLHGPIGKWTKQIIKEHSEKNSNSKILLATWENPSNEISAEIIKIEPPKSSFPYELDVNAQKNAILLGLGKIESGIVMICRTDQFIHNQSIFQIYEKNCPKNKIMIPNYLTIKEIDYLASCLVQIAKISVLKEFWNSIVDFEDNFNIHPEIYFTSNYLLRGKKDQRPWKDCISDYFFILDYKKDFQIEWEKFTVGLEHRELFDTLYQKCVKSEF